jgi:hypothetical protein
LLATLLAELAQGIIPSLPGARCRGREELFDQTITQADWDHDGTTVGYARKAAEAVCAGCPVLAQCAQWVDGLPKSQRPRGVVGGRLTDLQGRRWSPTAKRKIGNVWDTPESLSA